MRIKNFVIQIKLPAASVGGRHKQNNSLRETLIVQDSAARNPEQSTLLFAF
jgi:hypothetical protein